MLASSILLSSIVLASLLDGLDFHQNGSHYVINDDIDLNNNHKTVLLERNLKHSRCYRLIFISSCAVYQRDK